MNENLDPHFSLKREHKGNVARTHKDSAYECRLTRRQFDRLENHEKVAVYFAANISRRVQADFFNDASAALNAFALTLSP
jgi:hypothetical protein